MCSTSSPPVVPLLRSAMEKSSHGAVHSLVPRCDLNRFRGLWLFWMAYERILRVSICLGHSRSRSQVYHNSYMYIHSISSSFLYLYRLYRYGDHEVHIEIWCMTLDVHKHTLTCIVFPWKTSLLLMAFSANLTPIYWRGDYIQTPFSSKHLVLFISKF